MGMEPGPAACAAPPRPTCAQRKPHWWGVPESLGLVEVPVIGSRCFSVPCGIQPKSRIVENLPKAVLQPQLPTSVLPLGTRAINITEITTTSNTTTTTTTETTTTTTDTTTTDTTTTDTTTTDTTTTDTTTTDTTTTETTTTLATTAPNVTISKNTIGNGTQTPISSRATVVPTIGNSTSFQSGSSSTDKVTAKSTALPTSANITDNGNGWIPVSNTSTPRSSPVVPTFPTGASTGIPITSARGNGSSSAQVVPTQQTAVTAQGSTAAGQTPPAVPGSSSGPDPSKTAALLPTTVQLLVPIPLSFRILNRSFNESLRDPTSRDYRSLSYSVLTMFESVFGCTSCALRQSYKGCSELRFSPGSVRAQSTLVFGHGEGTVTSDTAEQQLRNSLNQDGFIRDLQLVDIQTGTVVVTSPAPVSAVPDWAIALLVLVSILLLLSILTCFLMTTCTCRRKSRGKLDLLSTKDSYNPPRRTRATAATRRPPANPTPTARMLQRPRAPPGWTRSAVGFPS
ncbi:mucin 1, cell surface associated, partial [Columba livia]